VSHNFALSGDEMGEVRLWNLEHHACIAIYHQHLFPVWAIASAPYGHYFATGSFDKTARVWSQNSITAHRVMVGHLSDVTAVRFHPNSFYLVTGSDDKTVRVWDISTGVCARVFHTHREKITALYVTLTHVASVDLSGAICYWDIDSRDVKWTQEIDNQIQSISISQEKSSAIVGCRDGQVFFIDVDSGRLQYQFPTK
jgi:transcription initiation factor TFIID subunit 5